MNFNCRFYKLNVSDRAKTICCDHCNQWIHISYELNDIAYELCTKGILPFFSKKININDNNLSH